MFDSKQQPQDIFEGVEPPANLPVAGIGSPASPAPNLPTPPPSNPQIIQDKDLGSGGHVWKTVVIVVIAFLAMGLAAYLAFRLMNPVDKQTVADDDDTTQADTEAAVADPDGKGPDDAQVSVPEVEVVIDTDGDGLNNDQEQAAGTSVSKPDTDSDLLGDREEVQVYGTDPLRADTDGDSFADGQEVRSGYNPNGPGKILELPNN